MANSGSGSGAKFVSVNLNKSYGQSSHSNHSTYSGSYGQATAFGRGKGGTGGGSGGMVVLSRSRVSQKPVPKLSVPPPLNLPSLRKEHERFDVSGSGSGSAGGSGTGVGTRPGSSGVGWTKTVSIGSLDKNGNAPGEQGLVAVDGESRAGVAYTPPSARSSGTGVVGVPGSSTAKSSPQHVEKAVVLRGEDFPSLQAALPALSGSGIKHKDNLNHKQKQVSSELADQQRNRDRDGNHFNSAVDMRPQAQTSRQAVSNGKVMDGNGGHGSGDLHMINHSRKEDLPGLFPLVRLNPRSDWADDERDTGHGFGDCSLDFENSKSENYWDCEFDMPRTSVFPHKSIHNQHARLGLRDDETGRSFSSEVLKLDPYRRDTGGTPNREGRDGSAWRSSSLHRDGVKAQEDKNNVGTRVPDKDILKENRYTPPHSEASSQYISTSRNQEISYGRRDMGHVQEVRQPWNNRGTDRFARDRYGNDFSSRQRGDSFQNGNIRKFSFVSGSKMSPGADSVLSKEKHALSKTERSYFEDPFSDSAGFDERDPFTGRFPGVIKRKKDTSKQTDFHDPVRESFEAELVRVQEMQELDRQRIIEEQERATEQARREEEERQRLILEEEERQRRLEEEAREAACRAEQERQEAARKEEQLKMARKEEKMNFFLEEERRKQAAYQKLLELEAKIAKRGAENTDASSARTMDNNFSGKDKDVSSSSAELDTWEDSERMVERITASTSFDSPILNRSFDVTSRPYSTREGASSFVDKGKPSNSWRRDVYGNVNNVSSQPLVQEITHLSPKRDSFSNGRIAPRKEFYGGSGYMYPRHPSRGMMQEPCGDEFGHQKDLRWNFPSEAESYSRTRDMELEFQDNPSEKYSDFGWGQNRFRGNSNVPFLERHYPNSEVDEHSSYGRSRYPVRQPRVLPPPLIASTQKSSFRGVNDSPVTSGFLEKDDLYNHEGRIESTGHAGYYTAHQDGIDKSNPVNMDSEPTMTDDSKVNKDMTPRCDSQSSVSVSSPPNSPPHLSHDELDESGDSPFLSAREGSQVSAPSGKEGILSENLGQHNVMTASSSISRVEDDEWTIESDNKLQEQEEYDEDEDGYQEEDEAHEGDAHNINLKQDFDDLHLEDKSSSHMVENLVLGFDEGVEVEIPSDDLERNLSLEEDRGPGIPDSSSACTVGERLADDVNGDECYVQITGSSEPTVIQEPDKEVEDSVAQFTADPYTSTNSDDNVHTVKQTVSVSDGTGSSSGPSEGITRLQFGLFSGPPLIPSPSLTPPPVSALQIGSIQMPLHLHSPVGTSLTHVHQPQSRIFQFGQFKCNSPISEGLLPVPSQSMSCVQPSVQTLNSLNQCFGNSVQLSCNSSAQSGTRDDLPSLALKNRHSGCVVGPVDQSHRNPSLGFSSSVVIREIIDDTSTTVISGSSNSKRLTSESAAHPEVGDKNDAVLKHPQPLSRGRLSEPQWQNQQITDEPFSEMTFGGMKSHGSLSVSKGKRFTYSGKNSSRSFPPSDFTGSDANGFQRRSRRTVHRTEFRVRENGERRQPGGSVSLNTINMDAKSSHNGKSVGNFARNGSKRFIISSKPMKQVSDSEGGLVAGYLSSQEINSTNQLKKEVKKDASLIENLSRSGEGNLKRNIPEEDFDAPLQSGVVRVFKQPGIEAPSDEDDFIEVRSKRQMLNDRREQREKEIKAKSRVTKLSRKPRSTKATGLTYSKKVNRRDSSQNNRSHFASSRGQTLVYKESSIGVLSQTLAPIGTPAAKSESQADKRSQITPIHTHSVSTAKGHASPVMFENKSTAMDNVPPLNSWDNSRINHQVMTLTQTQLEEAMKPPRYDAPIASVGGHSSASSEALLSSSSILSKERSFPSAVNPINSLLAGEKIQFGAVTSPTVLPPSNRAPGSSRSEIQMPHKLSADVDDCTLFFEKDEQIDNSCACLRDSEAEAAASAVAVAAISTDEVVVNRLSHVSISDSKNFGGKNIDGIPTGMVDDQQLANQSRAEESLTVSLPADLSLETPSISLWPTISSPQSSSNQMLSHFPGGPPSHFPFYEMNPMMGGPFFAFGPHEESSGSKSQVQKSNPVSSSGLIGTWQQCHSGVDSFYGPPAGFTGPFINHPGVQGHPHMVVYNHFAPVGQFGPVGLGFMGPAYVPSGKPPDWKHNAPSQGVVMGDGDMNNSSIAPAHRNITQGSTLLPMPSPMAMFDVSPFQSAPDISGQARWSHVPGSSLHAVSLTRPHQQQVDGVVPSQFGHMHSMPRSSTLSEKGANFSLATEPSASQLAEELSMGGSSMSTAAGVSPQTVGVDSSSISGQAEVGKTNNLRNSGNNNSEGNNTNSSCFKTRPAQQKTLTAQQSHSTNYSFQRSGAMGSQRNNSGSDWSHHRMGFHGRNPSSVGVEKGFPSSKMKQVYVPKQTNGTLTRE